MYTYKNILTRNNLLYLAGTGWGTVGFNRGVNEYDYKHKYNDYYKKKYFYTDRMFSGFLGFFVYINPFLAPYIIYKELYRLEVNYRGLDDEKKTEYYYKII